MTTNTPIDLDREQAADFRRALLAVNTRLQAAFRDYCSAKKAVRDARKRVSRTAAKTDEWIAAAGRLDDVEFVQRLRELDAAEAQARTDLLAAKAKRDAARKKYEDLDAEKRVKIRKQFEFLPLFDRPPETNGHAAEPTPAKEEPARCCGRADPSGAICPRAAGHDGPCTWEEDEQLRARNFAARGRLRIEVGGEFLRVSWDEPRGIFEAEADGRFGNWHEDATDPEPSFGAIAAAVSERLGLGVEVAGVTISPKGRPTFGLRRAPAKNFIDVSKDSAPPETPHWRSLPLTDLELPRRLQRELIAAGIGGLSGPGTIGELADRLDADTLRLDAEDLELLRGMIRDVRDVLRPAVSQRGGTAAG